MSGRRTDLHRDDIAPVIQDGNEAIREEIPLVMKMIERTARWVHPETFRRLPVWCPWAARGRQLYDSSWTRKYTNTKKSTNETMSKVEGNIAASDALRRALGVRGPKPKNWTVCHIWGYDDDAFAAQGRVVRDPRYFSCVGNMVWLPTPLKGFTDALPEIKTMLRTCAFRLYGWACEHDDARHEASKIRGGLTPAGYPVSWPTADRPDLHPAGTAPFTADVEGAIEKQKKKIRTLLADTGLLHFPREDVKRVLDFWRIAI